jgi:diaminopimelate decarboxylase
MKIVKDRWFRRKAVRVSVRWNPGIGRGFSPKVITAGEGSVDGTPIKFGVEGKKVLATMVAVMLAQAHTSRDGVAVLDAGAYARTMASHYNLRPIPKEIMI